MNNSYEASDECPNIFYDAPIEIKNESDLKYFGITWKDCVKLKIGGVEMVNVHMVKTTNVDLAHYCWTYLNTQHSRNCRSTRCMVPGKQGLIVWPDCNKCKCCPFGRKPEDRQPRVIIIDDPTELDNDGYTDDVDVQLDLDIIAEKIKHKNQLIAEVFSL